MKTNNNSAGVLASFLLFVAGVHGQGILANGSFETYGGTGFNSNLGSGLQGWTIGNGGGIDIVLATGVPLGYWQPADGNVSLSLNWYFEEAISQTVSTTPAMGYHLSFFMAAEIYGGPPTRTMDVRWNGALLGSPAFAYTGQTPGNMGWTQFGYDVVGTGSDTLTFVSTTSGAYGPALDGVALVAIPEPSNLALVAVSCLAFFFCRWTQRSNTRPNKALQ
jgi:hypothetical protein